MTKVTIHVRCSECGGNGGKGVTQPSASLAAKLREFASLHRENAKLARDDAARAQARLDGWYRGEAEPVNTESLAGLSKSIDGLSERAAKAARSRELLDEIRRDIKRL